MSRIFNFLAVLTITISLFQCGISRDEALTDQAENTTQKISISQKMKESTHLSLDEKIELYLQLKKENHEAYNFENEDELTMYGYSFLWNNQVKEAIKIFQLIVSEFGSSNSYDSLGEAYLKDGNTELALINYKKSLEMNPDNFNAEDQIELMEHPERKPETPLEKFAKIYTVKQYRDDLDQLGKKLLEVHPNALKFISKEDFLKNIEDKKALITDQTTYAAFVWHCNDIIASINCSHTSLGRFFQEADMLSVDLRFPVQVRWVNEQLFVIDPMDNSKLVKIKDEIISINGIPVADLVQDIYKHISSQGYIETAKKQFFNTWATAMIPYALNFPENYKIVVKGKKDPIILNKSKSFKDLFIDPSIPHCEKNLCLEIVDKKTAVLTIASFNYYPWNNLAVFTEFIDKSMKEINEKKIVNLIIDVRFNGGGSMESSTHLLRYLMSKSFSYYSKVEFDGKTGKINGEDAIIPFKNRFKGKQYFLIDGEGNSTTGHFMSLVKVHKLGTIIGEELGSNHFCSAGQTVCRLSNTKLQYYVANNTHVSTASSLPDEVGVLPDYHVTQTIDEYLAKKDAVKTFAFSLIKNNK